MNKRQYLETLDVKKLVKNGLLPFTTTRDINIFDAVFAFEPAFERGIMTKGEAMDSVARTFRVSERTVRKIVREMRANII